MAGKEHDAIDKKADNIAAQLDRGEGVQAVQSMRNELQSMSPSDFSRLIKSIDQKDNKKMGDNIEIVDTRDEKLIIMTGSKGEALVGKMK